MIPARGPPADHQIRPFCETRAEEIIPLEGLVVGWLQNVLHSHNRGEGGGRDLLILSKIARKSRDFHDSTILVGGLRKNRRSS